MNQPARWILFGLGLLLFVVALKKTYDNATPPDEVRVVEGYKPWDKETLELADTLPVQDGGRIKPLTTYAGFSMLRIYGARSMEIMPEEGGEKIRIKPLAWLMDVFFRPQYSIQMPSFRIEDSEILRAIGVEPGDRRDRYSYEDLEPGRDRLFELARGYGEIPAERRDGMEKQIIALASNVQTYEQLLGTFGMARGGLVMESLGGSDDHPKRADVSSVMATAEVIQGVLQRSQAEKTPIPAHVQSLLEQIINGANAAKFGLFVFPSSNEEDEKWLSPGERVMNVMQMKTREAEQSIKDIALMEATARALPEGEEVFRARFGEFKDSVVERAEARGEYAQIQLEADYYKMNWFLYALVFFLMGTVLAIGMWMTGRTLAGTIFTWSVWATTLCGLVFVIIPIVKRCIIMQRPPVGNLYDTIIFICAAVIILGALIELLTKRRFALGALPIAGVMLILLARMFEVGDAKDHMDPLVAVLRSNYWLTTHVICITLGYAGGLVTALLGMIYVLLRGLRLDGGDKDLRRSLTRAVYGMVCLTLFLSLVGTVLGGIWANDSWGRFWGWDPKENGALLIVLMNLAILHARLGGFLREWGIHLAAIFMAAVVTFSWWGVNLLGTGLHSYGFAEGGQYIWLLYGLVALLIVFGLIARTVENFQASEEKSSKGLKEVEG
ncbi:cytochrome c biogenesis protein [Haloferula chungangensis]|uniref:Cytochrome c biogenesis protein n=1 Tax=Haloferula chungangensis TaxID=1048331 RepID=A0ABW2L3B8_9BACT